MEALLGIFLYSYLYLNYQKCFVLLNIFYTFSSTKLEITVSAWKRWVGAEGGRGRREGWGVGGEMTQTLYARMNKQKNLHIVLDVETCINFP
jgi:hypothetical protein